MFTFLRFLVVSFLIWLIPFVSSFFFFGRDGSLTINFWLFKGIMALVLFVCSVVLFRWWYGTASLPTRSWWFAGLIGLGTVAINIVLDTQTVMRLTNIAPGQYFIEVAALYLLVIVGVSIAQRTHVRKGEQPWQAKRRVGRSA
jgi:hypothetical protein